MFARARGKDTPVPDNHALKSMKTSKTYFSKYDLLSRGMAFLAKLSDF